jgi:hypothetical protein
MQATFERLRANYQRCAEGSNPQPRRFARMVKEEIGLVDKHGSYFKRPDGFPMLAKERRKTTEDFPLALLTEAMLGRDWRNVLHEARWLSEEAVAPIGPSHFANVSAWTATVGGLVQGSILEGYETQEFDLIDLFPTRPVVFWQGGERYTAVIGPSKPAPKVGPGESHPDARMDAMWVEPGPMNKYGQKLTIARETAFVDITGGQVLAAARDLGYGLRFREHELILDVITGVTNNFKLGLTADAAATGYNTFGATVPTGNGTTGTLGNDIVNPMIDPFSTFQTSDTYLTKYKHPVTGITMPMSARLKTLLLPSTLSAYGMFLNGLADISILTQPGAPVPTPAGTYPTGSMTGKNPFAGRFNVRVSEWLWEKHTRSTTQTDPDISPGLGLSDTNANRWYRLDPARFACRRAAWDVTTVELAPNSFPMADQNLVFGSVANMAVQIQVLSPWAIQRHRVS